ncbi:hypothetical protein BJV74DRAFT_880134 [Russula compacta]|nr:hypothetical protein BJV74DRAFT_880134 [Russula compacta]
MDIHLTGYRYHPAKSHNAMTSRPGRFSISPHPRSPKSSKQTAEQVSTLQTLSATKNQKYNVFTFLPIVFYEQFKFFFNVYFLLVALSQLVPALRTGFLVMYIAPLSFVLLVTMGKEAYDDYKRNLRDLEANSAHYLVLASHPLLPSDDDELSHSLLEENHTDQLDGETDWKLCVAVPATQKLPSDRELLNLDADIYADAPSKDIHSFIRSTRHRTCPLTMCPWSKYQRFSRSQHRARAVMNTSHPQTKVGLLGLEISQRAKILCAVSFVLSVALVALNGFRGLWYIHVFRFLIFVLVHHSYQVGHCIDGHEEGPQLIVFSFSLRVNLDMGKTVYAHLIMKDNEIPGTIVRTSTLPEELGRIEYLLSDKIGTLTQNEMEMKKLHLGTMSFGYNHSCKNASLSTGVQLATRGRRDISARVRDVVLSLALCHNVTPVTNDDGSVTHQASSPDEITIVKWTKSVGVTLTLIAGETANMAREGLRTLVVGRRKLSVAGYEIFKARQHAASVRLEGRNEAMAAVVSDTLEHDLELLGLTGVEDKLQDHVHRTLEPLRNAGIKIWMPTGDKIETATVIAISTKLVAGNQYIHQLKTQQELDFLQNKLDCCLVINGESLYKGFIEITTKLFAVVACRCPPIQKADVARLIRNFTKKRVCCIGDGGNDVSMMQAANVDVGIVGKEGKQASLAADFSVTQFSHLTKLLLWHGRNSYRRSAKLTQFVIHRGLIISVMQTVFSAVLPELYKELTKGRTLSSKTFFIWLMISLYQGTSTLAAIPIIALVLFENEFLNIVAISFMALILHDLIMVTLDITIWFLLVSCGHVYMIISEVITLAVYPFSMVFLPEYFDLLFVVSVRFGLKVAVIVAVSALPLWFIKLIKSRIAPESTTKLWRER